MKKNFTIAGLLIGLTALLWIGYTPNIPVETLTKKYSNHESEFVSNDQSLRVHFRDEGVPDGKVIVLLHGNSNSLHAFDPLVDELKHDYRIVRLDFPGHGLTGAHPQNQYGYKELSQAVSMVVESLSLQDFTLLGHSMGGWVAWRYAVDHPEQLSSLILMSASGMPKREGDPQRDVGLGFKLLQSPIGPYLSAYSLPRITVQKSTEASVFNKNLVTDRLIDQYWDLLRHPQNRTALAHRAHAERELNKADLAKSIKVPTLLLWGEHDTFTPASAALSFAERINNTKTVILPEVGHMPMFEATDLSAQSIREFLEGVL